MKVETLLEKKAMRQLLTVQQTILAGGTCSVSDLTVFLAVTKASFEKDLVSLLMMVSSYQSPYRIFFR